MAVDFSLNYKVGSNNYNDIFLETGMEGIVDNTTALKYSTLDVTIPVTDQHVQSIPFTVTPKQADSNFSIYLISPEPEAKIAYGTISQVEVTADALVVTRLYSFPKIPINVKLLFKERGTQ